MVTARMTFMMGLPFVNIDMAIRAVTAHITTAVPASSGNIMSTMVVKNLVLLNAFIITITTSHCNVFAKS